jgi:SAM-dependent methyltransferase
MKFLKNTCVCRTETSKTAFPIADWNFSNVDETGMMLSCISCGSLFPDKFPSDELLKKAYGNYYTRKNLKNSLLVGFWRSFLKLTGGNARRRHLPADARTILDYGCGSGEWLTELGKAVADLDLYGTDIVTPRDERLSFKWIEPDTIEQVEGGFDFIALCHVVEHLRSPREVITRLRNCLAPGGMIWIATPNAESYIFKCLAGRSRDADFPRHRQIFSRQLLLDILNECGLSVEFMPSPRINTILNFVSGLTVRKKQPIQISPPVGLIRPIFATIKHLIKTSYLRMQSEPEIILVARIKNTKFTY